MFKFLINVGKALILALCFTSCASIKHVGTNAVANMLSGSDKKGNPIKRASSDADIMSVVTGENDPILVGEFFPTALKMYEIMQATTPKHQGLTVTCGMLNVMYANAFIKAAADKMNDDQYDVKNEEYKRAVLHYVRGRDYILNVFEARYPGFKSVLMSSDEEGFSNAVTKLKASDVPAAYWCAAGALGAFALDPLNPDILGSLRNFVILMQHAAYLNPQFNDGAILLALAAFYVAAPADFGGDYEKGIAYYEQVQKMNNGKSAAAYMVYAESVCISKNDRQGFENALHTVLTIDPDENPSNRLITLLYQDKARYLLSSVDNYFITW
ncbi:MAG: TRAP transporter TatT component family protein [Treponema sp.]|nr:TRAP transporter TatT component family protein [Treponema sp.]